jgi:hypothetical protein
MSEAVQVVVSLSIGVGVAVLLAFGNVSLYNYFSADDRDLDVMATVKTAAILASILPALLLSGLIPLFIVNAISYLQRPRSPPMTTTTPARIWKGNGPPPSITPLSKIKRLSAAALSRGISPKKQSLPYYSDL